METTAEGVETFDELELVRLLGVSQIQGFIYEGPISSAQASMRLADGLSAIASAPRAVRARRRTLSRKVELEHDGTFFSGTIRNLSRTGALVQGLWDVPEGMVFRLHLGLGETVVATTRWSAEDRMGMEFASPLRLDQDERNAAAVVHVSVDAPCRKAG